MIFSAFYVIYFFPKLDRAEANNKAKEIRNLMKKSGVKVRVSGSIVKIETGQAYYMFNPDTKKGKLTYTSKNFYKGLRSEPVDLSKDMNLSEIFEVYIAKAKEMDTRLAYGVGSEAVSSVLKQLCAAVGE